MSNAPTPRQVLVYNRNTEPLEEQFKGRNIIIPPGECVEMGRAEAIQFKGQYHPIVKNETQGQLTSSKKIIEIVPKVGSAPEKPKFICQQDGTEHKTQALLDLYISENYADQIQDQEFAKEFTKKVNKKGG